MRNLTAAVGLGVMIAAPTAHAQEAEFRPAIDAIGEAYAPASESGAAVPDGVDLGSARSGRGRVTIESGTISSRGAQTLHRKTWVISR
jgi:hypothetical protein